MQAVYSLCYSNRKKAALKASPSTDTIGNVRTAHMAVLGDNFPAGPIHSSFCIKSFAKDDRALKHVLPPFQRASTGFRTSISPRKRASLTARATIHIVPRSQTHTHPSKIPPDSISYTQKPPPPRIEHAILSSTKEGEHVCVCA